MTNWPESADGPGPSPSDVLADVVDRLTGQMQAGEAIDWDDLARRHPEHAEELRKLRPALGSLDQLSHSDNDAVSGLGVPPPNAGEPLSGMLGDFRLVREVGRGGMGVVYEAEQISLGRQVALKVLPFAAALDGKRLQRFKQEAHAAAQLHHTHIVPVHAVGCERGVHYYAMQFIQGQTLATVIRELRQLAGLDGSEGVRRVEDLSHAAREVISGRLERRSLPEREAQHQESPTGGERPPDDKAGPTPKEVWGISTRVPGMVTTERSTATPGFFRTVAVLGIQAAEALEHAHEEGVIHRDIKPGNLLVDGKGKLWVTDFGLARLQSDAGLTATGDLVGTMRYMSPEQALGRQADIDQRTDVYSLGATLYELATLHPAFGGGDRQELLRQIAFEEPRRPRQRNRAMPADLETILLKALSKEPWNRYATAQDLADDLRRLLEDRPIRARRPRLWHWLLKWARRHPGVSVTAALAMVAGLLLGMAGLAVNNRMVREERLRTQEALAQAEEDKAIAQAVRTFLRNKLLAQADPREQANARLRGAKSGVRKPNPTILELLDRAAAELAPDRIERQFPAQPMVQAELLKTIGEAYGAIGEYSSATAHLERARDLQSRELGPEHAVTLATVESLARTRLDAGKPDEAARLFEQVRDLRIQKLGPDHRDTLASMSDLVRCYYKLRRHAEALALREEIVRLRKATLGLEHPDTLASMNNLANSYAKAARYADALQLHEKTLALRKATLEPDHPDTLQSMNNLANTYDALGQHAESLKLHQETLALRKATLGADHPDTLQSMYNVAVGYTALGQQAEAIQLHDEALTRRTAKLHLDHPDTLVSMNALAWLLATAADPKLRNPDRALTLARQATRLAPEQGDFLNTFGVAYYRVGDWKNAVKELAGSVEARKGGDATDWFFLALAHWQLGDKDQARTWYDRAVGWMEKTKSHDEELGRFRAEAAGLLEMKKR